MTAESTGAAPETAMLSSVAMLPNDALAVSHLNKSKAQVLYSKRTATGWTQQCVAPGIPIVRSIRVDASGAPVLGFMDEWCTSFQLATLQ